MKTKLNSSFTIRYSAFTTIVTTFLAALAVLLAPSPASAQTNWGYALSFDGVNDYVDVIDGVYFSGDFTVEAWVKVKAYTYYARVLDFGNGQYQNNVICILSEGTSGKPAFHVHKNGGYTVIAAPNPLRWTPKIGPPVKMDFPRSAGEKADDESQTQTA